MNPFNLTAIMYHYVRDVEKTAFPNIKALSCGEFDVQLEYLQKNYSMISWLVLKNFLEKGTPLPKNPCLLTFDDGFQDGYTNVFPRLKKRGLSGLFFPIAPRADGGVALVHLLHFLIAKLGDSKFRDGFREALSEGERVHFEECISKSLKNDPPDIFGEPELRAMKRVIQRDMPQAAFPILEKLFKTHIGNPVEFAKDLYLSPSHTREMVAGGMHFGGHGTNHYWFNRIDEKDVRGEIEGSRTFLEGVEKGPWAFSCPYGEYEGSNKEKIFSLLKDNNFIAAFTIQEFTTHSNPYEIHRFDTVSFPPRKKEVKI